MGGNSRQRDSMIQGRVYTRGSYTPPPGSPPGSHHNQQFHQVTSSHKHLLWFSTALLIRVNSLINKTPPLALTTAPHIITAPKQPAVPAGLFSAIWEAICHPLGLSRAPVSRDKRPPVLPVGGADPHGCPPTSPSPACQRPASGEPNHPARWVFGVREWRSLGCDLLMAGQIWREGYRNDPGQDFWRNTLQAQKPSCPTPQSFPVNHNFSRRCVLVSEGS